MNLFTFDSKLSSSTIQAHPVGLSSTVNKTGVYDKNELIKGFYDNITFPVFFKQRYGKRLEDVLNTGWAGLYLISDKFKRVLEESCITGWNTFEIRLLNLKGLEISGYHGLSITGRAGSINFDKSEIIEKRLIENGPLVKFYKGLYVDLEKWDNSDIFLPEKYSQTIVTQKVKDILKKNKITNIMLVSTLDVELNELTVRNIK